VVRGPQFEKRWSTLFVPANHYFLWIRHKILFLFNSEFAEDLIPWFFSGNPVWVTVQLHWHGQRCQSIPAVIVLSFRPLYFVSSRPKYWWCCFLQQINNNRTIPVCWTNERSHKESCRVMSKAPVMKLQL